MVAIGISEFTFGYAFLYEQTSRHWGNLRAAPILPSLQQEAGQGWDAHLPTTGVDFYYQFKLSDYLRNGHAKFIKDGTYNSPYFRIAFHKNDNNRQHRRLKEHAIIHPHTYYVAPEITYVDDFNNIFLNGQVTEHSRLFQLTECDDIDINDVDQHYITFQRDIENWIQHSNRKRHFKSVAGKNILDLYEGTITQKRRLDKAFAEELFKRTSENVLKSIEVEGFLNMPEERDVMLKLLDQRILKETKEKIVKRTSQILTIYYGLTMVIVTEK